MTDESTHMLGLAVLDRQGRIVFAQGEAAEPRLRSLIADPAWLEEARSRRILAVSPARDRRLLAMIVALADGEAVLLAGSAPDMVYGFLASVDFAWDVLRHLLTDPFEAMTVVDAAGRVAFISSVHETFFGLSPGEATGRPVRDVIENTQLHRVLKTGRTEVGEIQRMKGVQRVVTRVPIRRGERVIGAIGRVMFEGPEQVEALSRRVNDLEREVAFYRRGVEALRGREGDMDAIVGESSAVERLRAGIRKVAPLDVPVLVQGESGTGKELVANALHRLSPRRAGPLIVVNAAALPPTLVESELFGYAPGSFTGAERRGRKGRFEQAEGGTIFLDEIGDMPLETQAKLLRVLQERAVEPVGGSGPVRVDFRLITATNRDLKVLVEQGLFRLDLYYRISAVLLEVPPLSERLADIPLLARRFLGELARLHGLRPPALPPEVARHLMALPWPGNVRQLRHAVESALIFAEGEVLTVADFQGTPVAAPARPSPAITAPLHQATARLAEDLIREALLRAGGNKKRAAADLGISRSHLYKRLAELGIA